MGKVISTLSRPIRNFNVENRAMKAMERQARMPKSAPKHATTVKGYDKLARDNPDLINAVKMKDEALHDRLKKVWVDSTGPPPEESLVSKQTGTLPLLRSKVEEADFGYLIPDVIPEGRVSLQQVFEFISRHQENPKDYNVAKIAEDYKLSIDHAQQIIDHFQAFNMYVPKKIRDKIKSASPEEIAMMAQPPQLVSDTLPEDENKPDPKTLPHGNISEEKR